jgi:hypothetical protein
VSTVAAEMIRAEPARPGPGGDWRVVRMLSLVEDPWLPGEWDPVRLLLTPLAGGLLCRRRRAQSQPAHTTETGHIPCATVTRPSSPAPARPTWRRVRATAPDRSAAG